MSRASHGPAELGKALFASCHVAEMHDHARGVLLRKWAESEQRTDLLALDLGCTERHARRLLQAYEIRLPVEKPQVEQVSVPSGYAPHPLRRDCECRWCAWRREQRRAA